MYVDDGGSGRRGTPLHFTMEPLDTSEAINRAGEFSRRTLAEDHEITEVLVVRSWEVSIVWETKAPLEIRGDRFLDARTRNESLLDTGVFVRTSQNLHAGGRKTLWGDVVT